MTKLPSCASEVDAMLDWLDASPLAKTLRHDGHQGFYLEMPFAWDWDGIPVHGINRPRLS